MMLHSDHKALKLLWRCCTRHSRSPTPRMPDMGHRPGAAWDSRSASPLPAAFAVLLLTKHIKSSAWERCNCSGYSSLKNSRALAKSKDACLKNAQRTSDAVKLTSESHLGQASHEAPVGYHSMCSHSSTGGTIDDVKRPFSLHYHLSAALWPSLQTEVGTSPALAMLRVPAAPTALAHMKGPDLVLCSPCPCPIADTESACTAQPSQLSHLQT